MKPVVRNAKMKLHETHRDSIGLRTAVLCYFRFMFSMVIYKLSTYYN